MYNIRYLSYDIMNARVLTLDMIFRNGYEKSLQKALDAAARERAGLEADAPLDGYYFVEHIPLTDNFFYTPSGIIFGYDP
ncbi:MAG: hypothetical protein IPL65_10470 [Lewinellaceae bacterium]|nr:hypothetical protein [Lewinellaceae bacterium]